MLQQRALRGHGAGRQFQRDDHALEHAVGAGGGGLARFECLVHQRLQLIYF